MNVREFWHQFRNFELNLDIGKDRNILIICIGIAFFFWLIVKLSKEYETHKHVAAAYTIPADLAFSRMPPGEFTAELEGSGWDLLYEYFINGDATVQFDLSQQQSFDLNRPEIESKIKSSLSSRVKITDLDYDYLQLALEQKVQKKVPLVFNQKINLEPGFQQLGYVGLQPDSVLVVGPSSLLDTISSWPLNVIKIPLLKSNFEETVALKMPVKKEITIKPTEILLSVVVEQLTEKSFFIPVTVKNAPDSIKIFPDKIRINSTIGLSEYNSLQPLDFIIEADLKDASLNSESNTVPLSLTKQPDYIEAVNFSPKSVEYFIVRSEEK